MQGQRLICTATEETTPKIQCWAPHKLIKPKILHLRESCFIKIEIFENKYTMQTYEDYTNNVQCKHMKIIHV